MHQEVTSPSPSSRKFFHMPKSFRRTAGLHYFCSNSKIQCFISETMSFSPVGSVKFASALVGLLIKAPPSYPVCRTVVWPVASIGGDVSRQLRRLPRWQNRPWRPAGASPAVGRRPAAPAPPGASAWPSSSLCVLQNRRRGLRGVERALCRRRARELRSVETTGAGQIRPS